MIIDIDAGNSSIKWRLRNEDGVIVSSKEEYQKSKCLSNLVKATHNCSEKVKQVNLANVCSEEKTTLIKETIRSEFNLEPLILVSTKKIGDIINSYENPELMGVDRWAAILAATELLKSNHSYASCIIDAGTATTIDFVCPDGKHDGGYILPGIRLQIQSLNAGANQIDIGEDGLDLDLLPGKSTEVAVKNGIILSTVSLIENSLNSYYSRYKIAPKLFITGGNGLLIKKSLSTMGDYHPDLVLDGLVILQNS